MKPGTILKTCAAAAAVTALTWVLSAPNHASAAITYDTRALTGDQAPGTDPGVVYSSLGTPVLNGAGQISFLGDLTGPGVDATNNSGIWSEGTGSLGLVARTGGTAPGAGAGEVYSNLFNPKLNSAGQTAFLGRLTGAGVDRTNDQGIWSEGSGSLRLVAREGDAAPGAGAGVVYSFLDSPALNGSGQISFLGDLTGPGVDGTNDRGIWSKGTGLLGLVARTGDAAPGTGAGVVYSFFSPPVLNGAGQTAFGGLLTGAGVDGTNDGGIWSEGTGSLGLVAREGDAAPGAGAGVVYSSFGEEPAVNDAGQTAFEGFLAGAGVNFTNDRGIWSGGAGSLGLVARSGDPVPGTGAGVVYSELFAPELNGVGQTAFGGKIIGAGVNDSNDRGIWSEGTGSLGLVAREGDAVPGTGAGVVYSNFSDLVLNGTGQTAFVGRLTGAGVNFTNDRGIWATDPDGLLTLIAREGDPFDVNDDPLIDDLRTVDFVQLFVGSGGEDGRASSFNDAGQLAFSLDFTDGSEGIFVATIGLPGDLNGDGFVGIADLNIVLGNWNQNVTPGDPLAGDATGDGFVGIADLNVVLGNWNAGTPPGASGAGSQIPEPGTAVSVLLLGGLALRRRPG